MNDRFLDRVYDAGSDDELQQLYTEWSGSYDREVTEQGYRTPKRCAAALARFMTDRDAPILDIGCGTGLSGLALHDQGFTNLAGTDINEDMLDRARGLGIYSRFLKTSLAEPVPGAAREYAALAAIGVIGTGAAPVSVLEDIARCMAPGAFLVFSMNDHTLALPEYRECVEELRQQRDYRVLHDEYGPHLTGLGLNSRVYVIERSRGDHPGQR